MEKAGIIKPDGIVVTSAQAPEALLTIAAVCQRQRARLVRIGAAGVDPAQSEVEAGTLPALSYRYRLEQRSESSQHFTVETPERLYKGLEIPLAGQYQLENATAALATLDMLRQQGIAWDEGALRTGLRNTRWPARIDVVGHNPTIVVDGAHNGDSMEKLVRALHDSFTLHRLIVVLSLMRDKDLEGVAKALASVDVVILTRVQNPRAATIEQMQATFAKYAPHVELYTADNSSLALDKAVILSEAKDLICATGSLYLAGEVLRWAAARGDATAAATIEGVDH
jgi:dihydrofolate synthase/folylpolyglutamate synthase